MSELERPSSFCLFCYKTVVISAEIYENQKHIHKFVKIVKRLVKSRETDTFYKQFATERLLKCCNKCKSVIEDACEIYNQLKILELKFDSKLNNLAEKIIYANKVPTRWMYVNKVLEETFLNDLPKKVEYQQDIRKFRQNIIEAGHQRKLQSQPRVLLSRTENITQFMKLSGLTTINKLPTCPEAEEGEAEIMRCPKGDKTVECPTCGKTLQSFKRLKDHLELHKDKTEWKYECHWCSRKFHRQTNLTVHIRSHTGERPFKCRFCNKGYRYRTHFTRHMKSVHSNEKGLKEDLKRKWFNKSDLRDSVPINVSSNGSLVKSSTVKNIHDDEMEYDDMPELDDYSEDIIINVNVDPDENYLPETENFDNGTYSNDDDDILTINMKTIEETASFQDPLIQIKVEHQPVRLENKPGNIKRKSNSRQHSTNKKSSKGKIISKKTTTKKSYKCKKCGKQLNSSSTFYIHLKSHKNPKNLKWRCKTCGKICSGRLSLQLHMKMHARKNLFKCRFCGIMYAYQSSLRNHLKEKHSEENEIEKEIGRQWGNSIINKGKPLTKTSFTQLESQISDKKFSFCKDCGKPFPTLQILKAHMNSTLCTKKPDKVKQIFKCEECGKIFRLDNELWRHQREIHEEKVCLDCGKHFRKTFNFKIHLEYHKDPKEWKFECETCGKKCVSSCKLKEHMANHKRENYKRRPRIVNDGTDKNNLKSHRKVAVQKKRCIVVKPQENQNGQKINCRDCGKVFCFEKKLWLHQREIHEIKVCLDCGKQFMRNLYYKLHLEYHKDPKEWKFECKICGRKSVSLNQLKRHMAIHAKKKINGKKLAAKQSEVKHGKDETVSDTQKKSGVIIQSQNRYCWRKNRVNKFSAEDDIEIDNDNKETKNVRENSTEQIKKDGKGYISVALTTGTVEGVGFDKVGKLNNNMGESEGKEINVNGSISVSDEDNLLAAKGDCFGDGNLVEFEDLD